jgi:hypothetical protein
MKEFEIFNESTGAWRKDAAYKSPQYAKVYADVLRESKKKFRVWENGEIVDQLEDLLVGAEPG